MRILIDIDDNLYTRLFDNGDEYVADMRRACVAIRKGTPLENKMTSHNLCSSCTNMGCEFQSGIVRTECAFFMPPHIEPDNCGNYVVMQPVKPQESSITWVTGADGAKIAFWDVPVWKVTKICEILGEPQESEGEE